MSELAPAHEAMKELKAIWEAVNIESSRANPDHKKIDELKHLMTKRAKAFLRKYTRKAA